jgi:hypothetical protein
MWKVLVAVVAVVVVGLSGYFGGTQDLQSGIQKALTTAAAFAIAFLLVYFWNVLAAPAKMDAEADAEAQKTLLVAQSEAVSLSDRLKPRIKIFLDDTTKGVTVSPTLIGNPPRRGPPCKWLQFCVSCSTEASLMNCEAILTGVHRLGDDDEVINEQLVEEHVNCCWSQQSELKVTIHPLRIFHANLFSVQETEMTPSGVVVKPETSPVKIRLHDAIQIPGRYRLDVLVTAQEAPSGLASFIFEWRNFADIKLAQI